MRNRISRRSAAVLAVVAAFAVVAAVAVAGTAAMNGISDNNTATLPTKNPTDIKMAQGKAFAWGIPASALQIDAANTVEWGNAETTGGGNLTISKATTDAAGNTYATVTVKSMDTGLVIVGAMATISGGQLGTTQITSTALSKSGMTYTVKLKWPGSEGTPGSLNLKWYTRQLAL